MFKTSLWSIPLVLSFALLTCIVLFLYNYAMQLIKKKTAKKMKTNDLSL